MLSKMSISQPIKLLPCLRYVAAILTIIFINSYAYANDLGTVGKVYPIQEEDLLNFILTRIQTMQQDGEWQKLQDQFREQVAQHADRPKPLRFISKAVKARSWHYDPSITIPYDFQDSQGNVFAKAGTAVNPLQFITIHKTLIFFDGDDTAQVDWVMNLNRKLSGKTKLILINGSIADQARRFKQPIYFDQAGRLVSTFHIQHVPATVAQEGLHLTISEIAI